MLSQFFLTGSEIALIKSDVNRLFKSKEATTVTLQYSVITNSDIDPTFGGDAGTAATQTVKVICLHQRVREYDDKILRFGILTVGDSIFWFPIEQNLNLGIKGSLVVIDQANFQWKPIVFDQTEKSTLIDFIVGAQQFHNMLACKLVQ